VTQSIAIFPNSAPSKWALTRSFQMLALCATLAMSACAGGSLVTGPYKVGASYDVNLQKTWSSISNFNLNREVKYLTIDGPLLNNFYLTEGLTVGRSIVRAPVKSRPMPIVKRDMSETELAEFVVDTVAAFGYEGVASENLRPAKFGTADAIRFDLGAKTDRGLDISGTAQVAMVGGKVHVMLFLAPSEYYYPSFLADVEQVFASATLRP
jgi:hypothetical protein